MAEHFKIMRAWDKGLNKIAYVYRNPETGKKAIGETKFDWWFYVLTEDYHRLRNHFSKFKNNNVINDVVEEGKYTRVYADYPHRTEFLSKDMERDWGYKTFAFNDMIEKFGMLECQTFEADIPPHKRFALQDYVEFEQEYKVLFLDIETDDRIKNGQPIPGEFRILSIAMKDFESGKEGYLVIKEDSDEEECALLTKVAKLFNSYDVLVAWNGLAFDFPYIKSRMMRYGIQLDWRKIFLQDQMKIFQKSVSLRSYSLENVSQEYLGEGKVEHEGLGIYQMWQNHPELLEKYNRVDVQRLFQLEQKTKYLAVARNVNAIGFCPCDDLYITRKIDNLIVKQAQEDKHYHFKTIIREYDEDGCLINHDEEDDDSFEGAYVFPPVPGRYKNTKVFDYSSLYPNVIKTLNISPDTLVENDEVPDELCIKTPSGHKYRKDFIGILPKVITKMKDKRDYYKDLMSKEAPGSLMHKTYDNLQYVYKAFGLSFYGALGEVHTRYYDVRIAESVTLGGQYFNKAGAKYLESRGYVILYGDSVVGERKTWVKIDNTEAKEMTFSDLFELAGKKYFNGEKHFAEFENCVVKTLSYDFVSKRSEWQPINCVIKHKTNKKIYEIVGNGCKTQVTEDHSLIDEFGSCFKPHENNLVFNVFDDKTKTTPFGIKEIDYSGDVYDLSVEKNNNFVDSEGNILLHNTDSLFVDKIQTVDEVITLLRDIKNLCEKIAKEEFNSDNCTLEMSYDKGFKTFLIVNAKKRYAGYLDYLDGHVVNPCKLKITGFEYVRTDQCGFVKKYQKEILEWILADEQPTALQIRSWILDKQSKVFSGKMPIEELMFAQKVTKPIEQYDKPLMHVKVAMQLLKDGKDFWIGDKVQYFIESLDTRQKPLPRPLYTFKGKYNEAYYWNNKIFPAFERILSVVYPKINWSEYYVKGGKGGSTKAGRSFLWS